MPISPDPFFQPYEDPPSSGRKHRRFRMQESKPRTLESDQACAGRMTVSIRRRDLAAAFTTISIQSDDAATITLTLDGTHLGLHDELGGVRAVAKVAHGATNSLFDPLCAQVRQAFLRALIGAKGDKVSKQLAMDDYSFVEMAFDRHLDGDETKVALLVQLKGMCLNISLQSAQQVADIVIAEESRPVHKERLSRALQHAAAFSRRSAKRPAVDSILVEHGAAMGNSPTLGSLVFDKQLDGLQFCVGARDVPAIASLLHRVGTNEGCRLSTTDEAVVVWCPRFLFEVRAAEAVAYDAAILSPEPAQWSIAAKDVQSLWILAPLLHFPKVVKTDVQVDVALVLRDGDYRLQGDVQLENRRDGASINVPITAIAKGDLQGSLHRYRFRLVDFVDAIASLDLEASTLVRFGEKHIDFLHPEGAYVRRMRSKRLE